MAQLRHRLRQYSFKLVCWFASLSMISGGIWVSTNRITDEILSVSSQSVSPLHTDVYRQIELSRSLTIDSIHASVDHSSNTTEVTLKTVHSSLESMTFQFLLTDPEQLEATLASQLNISPESVSKLIHYRIE